jgi:hypothetical protein
VIWIGRKILEIEKPVIWEVAVVVVVFGGVIWNRNQIEGFSLVEKFQNEDAMSELFQFCSIRTQRQGTPFKRVCSKSAQLHSNGMGSIEWEWGWG